MIEKVTVLIEKLLALGNYSKDNCFELKFIFDEYDPIVRELNAKEPNLYSGEINAFADMFSHSDLLIKCKSITTQRQIFKDIKSGMLSDLKVIYDRLSGHIYSIEHKH